jgi:hypothetical protein
MASVDESRSRLEDLCDEMERRADELNTLGLTAHSFGEELADAGDSALEAVAALRAALEKATAGMEESSEPADPKS